MSDQDEPIVLDPAATPAPEVVETPDVEEVPATEGAEPAVEGTTAE